MNYKYTNYFCDDVIRELFDLQTDSAENTNVAYDPAYTITAISLQQKLDSMRISLGDISDATVSPCILLGSQEKKINFPAH